MFSNPDFDRGPDTAPAPALRLSFALTRQLTLALVCAGALSGCSWGPAKDRSVPVIEPLPVATPAVPAVTAATPVATPPPEPPPPPPPPAPDPVARVLAYAERMRTMPPNELQQEATRLNTPAEIVVPANQLQLALVLAQMRQLPELIRAHELLTRLLGNANGDAQPLHPLARVLALRFSEQRRLEDVLDKERQQTREVQKKLDQTNERLEALKAIERSLTTRPPAPPSSAPSAAPASAPAAIAAPRRRASTP